MRTRNVRSALITAAAILASSCLLADDWMMYLHGPRHWSYASSEAVLGRDSAPSLKPSWTLRTGSLIAAAPSVVNGILYVGDWQGSFYAIDAATGAVRWRQFVGMAPPPDSPECQPGVGVSAQATVVDDVVYVAGGDSAVYALDKMDGRIRWRLPLADPTSGAYLWSSFTLVGRSLYIGISSLGDCPLARGGLVRIDIDHPTDPVIRYLAPKGETGGGVWSTPAIDLAANIVFVTTGTGEQDPESGMWGGSLLALDATTLEIKRHFFLPSNSLDEDIEWGSSPTLVQTSDGARLVVATGKDGNLYCLNRDTLALLWTTNLAVSGPCPECGQGSLSTPAFDGNLIYVGAGVPSPDEPYYGSVYAINPADGSVVWTQSLEGTVIAPVTLAPGVVFASTLKGVIAFDAATGQRLWDDGGWGMIYSQPVIAGGTLYTTYLKSGIVAWTAPGAPAPSAAAHSAPRHH